MARSHLRVRFYDEGDGTGALLIHAEANGFAGTGDAYFSISQLEDFAAKLGAFPLLRARIAGGYYSGETYVELKQTHVAIECYPVDDNGDLALRLHLSTKLGASDRPESQQSVVLEIRTTYEPLRRFGNELAALIRGIKNEAFLEGD